MTFATATQAQRQAVRDATVNLDKAAQLANDMGSVAGYGPAVDTKAAVLISALSAATTGVAGTSAIINNAGSVTVPITFTTARTAGATATVAATFTIANGVVTAITIA